MAIHTQDGVEVEIVKVIQQYQNGTTKVGVRQVHQAHYDIVISSNLRADGGQAEIQAAIRQVVGVPPRKQKGFYFTRS